MNARSSAARLQESVRSLIMTEPTVASRLARGMALPDILASPEWAAEWAASADPLLKAALRRILARYGATAFEADQAEQETLADGVMTGAEWRVALARLRRSGVLIALRKLWGDRLFYLPSDMVPVWQQIVAPVRSEPLSADEAREVEREAAPYRLPLSLELLAAWALIARAGLPLTAKGTAAKPAAARLASAMRLTAGELSPLGLVYPQPETLPLNAAVALDLGLRTGVLRRGDKEISVSPEGAARWMTQSVPAADAALHRIVLSRYASLNPARHFAAAAVASCGASGWHRAGEIVRAGADPQETDLWLHALVSFGWAQRGTFRGEPVFQLLAPLDCTDARGAPAEEPAAGEPEEEPIYVQPDGEIYVTPGARLAVRWKLEQIADRVTADQVFVYRLGKAACARAYEAGWTVRDVREALERASHAPLPGPVDDALRDWFAPLGKVRLEEAVLLRTDSEATADRLLEDAELPRWLAERAGARDFIVNRGDVKDLRARLEKIGYPVSADGEKASGGPGAQAPRSGSEDDPGSEQSCREAFKAPDDEHSGWIHAGGAPALYQPDRAVESIGELFPGLAEIPSAWWRRPGVYHLSTRQKLVCQAMDWRTSLHIGGDGEGREFVPLSLQADGRSWIVQGRWRSAASAGTDLDGRSEENVMLPADRFEPVMIVLPEIAALSGTPRPEAID